VQAENFYTVEQAARALKLTPDRIRQMLRDGELEGVPPQDGGASGWMIPVRVIHGRDRPSMDRSESPTTDPESSPSGPKGVSGLEDERGKEDPTPLQPQRDDAADNGREPTAPFPYRVTAQEVARATETLLLQARDEAIGDLRDRVAFLERQLEDRAEEIRRRDHIIAALTERIPPAIEAPVHEKSPRASESTAEEPRRVSPSGGGGPKTGSPRPWWRRAFGR
jgi:hypothetical protein